MVSAAKCRSCSSHALFGPSNEARVAGAEARVAGAEARVACAEARVACAEHRAAGEAYLGAPVCDAPGCCEAARYGPAEGSPLNCYRHRGIHFVR